jgi:hypothetical protein
MSFENSTDKMHSSTTLLLSDNEEESIYPSIKATELVKRTSTMTAETELDDSLLLGEAYFFDEPPPGGWENFQDYDQMVVSRQPITTSNDAGGELQDERVVKDTSEDDPSDPALFLEVAPGLNLRLRDSVETMRAIKIGFITCSRCLCCGDFLHCIQDADYVFCYECGVVNPVELCKTTGESSVALGMQDHELVEALDIIYGRKTM